MKVKVTCEDCGVQESLIEVCNPNAVNSRICEGLVIAAAGGARFSPGSQTNCAKCKKLALVYPADYLIDAENIEAKFKQLSFKQLSILSKLSSKIRQKDRQKVDALQGVLSNVSENIPKIREVFNKVHQPTPQLVDAPVITAILLTLSIVANKVKREKTKKQHELGT